MTIGSKELESTLSVPGDNNLDMIRFVLAAMVFISHAHDLSGVTELSILSATISSTLAVQAFFVISGFLIFQSCERSSTLRSYTSKRIRRIFPAYGMVVLGSAVLLAFVSDLPLIEYATNPAVLKYIAANIVFLNFLAPELPGVFDKNIVHAVNGALWTLKIEVAFYVAVPICIWLFQRIGRTRMMVAIYVASVIYSSGMIWLADIRQSGAFLELGRQLPGQMCYFIAGAAIYYHFDRFRCKPVTMLMCGVILFLLSFFVASVLFRPIGLALLVMSLAFGPYLGRFGRFGDFSYGIYIVHFPVLQVLIALKLPSYSVAGFLIVSAVFVMMTAVATWHLVEKRFLRRDSHYRREAEKLLLRTVTSPNA